jgi:hypothetical protein
MKVLYIEEDENVIERLNIIIDYFLSHTDIDTVIDFNIMIDDIIDFLEKIDVISMIIKEYNDNFKTLIPKYTPSAHKLTIMYEGFIRDLVMKKKLITFTKSTITKEFNTVAVGGRKTKTKKQPKKAREEPKKTLNKPPKKPSKKVALKEPNVYGVIKHKIRI